MHPSQFVFHMIQELSPDQFPFLSYPHSYLTTMQHPTSFVPPLSPHLCLSNTLIPTNLPHFSCCTHTSDHDRMMATPSSRCLLHSMLRDLSTTCQQHTTPESVNLTLKPFHLSYSSHNRLFSIQFTHSLINLPFTNHSFHCVVSLFYRSLPHLTMF